MALPSSGALSVNDIHIEAGGSSGSLAGMNDSDIRSLIGKGAGATNSVSEYYGASSGSTVWIRAWGARGGYVVDYGGDTIYGKARECGWTGKVASGTVLYYVIGDYGQASANPNGAGGGAGTCVFVNNNFTYPLVISGGGGAGGIQYGGAIGTGGHAANGPGNGGNAAPGGGGGTFDAQGGRSSGAGGAHGSTRGAGFDGSSWNTTATRGRGGNGGDGGISAVGGQNGWSTNTHFAGGHGSYRAGDGGGGGGGGGFGGGGGGGSSGWPQPSGAGSSQVFGQAPYGATFQSSNGGDYRNYAGRVMIYVNGSLVRDAVSFHDPTQGNYTVP